jgi:hypothetical protein
VQILMGELGSVFVLQAFLSTGASLDGIQGMLDAATRRLRQDASTECRLDELIAREREDLAQREGAFGMRAVHVAEGMPLETAFERRQRVALPELTDVARRWLPERNRAIVLFRVVS